MQASNKRTFIYRRITILQQVFLFFLFANSIYLNELYSQNKGTANHPPNVSVHFEFDSRLKARPFRVILMKDEEFNEGKSASLDIDSNRIKIYRPGLLVYDFYDIEPGLYWVGVTFNILLKKKMNNLRVLEDVFIDPGISTVRGPLTYNRIEVTENINTLVDFLIHLRLCERPQGKDDPEGYFKLIERGRPKLPEEERMLDENYFPFQGSIFEESQRIISESFDTIRIICLIDGFDDYPII